MKKEELLKYLGWNEQGFKDIIGKSIDEFFDPEKNNNIEKFVALGIQSILRK